MDTGPEYPRKLDSRDELASFREAFYFPDPDLIYMDGNSLGRLPVRIMQRMKEVVESEWGHDLIRGWNAGWYQAPTRVGEKIAGLIGAQSGQVVVSDTTSVNLYKLAMTALSNQPERRKVISDVMNFPSDLYVLQGCIHALGNRHHLQLIPSHDGMTIDLQALYNALDHEVALVSLSHVAFKSGYLYDAAAVTERAHRVGALVLWDLCHSVGVVPIELDRWGVDLAVGCTYKYLNGGPGAPAFLYVRKGLQEKLLSPIWGWFGERSPFAFELQYQPAEGINRFLVSSPSILSLLAMESAIDIITEAGIERLRKKSMKMTNYLVYLIDRILKPLGFSLGSPRDSRQRGSHISIRHKEAYRINRALIEELNLIPDFREPDNIRLGLAPLYTTYAEVWEGVDRIRRALEEKRYLHYDSERLPVT
jgi:kynureninase